jgi:tRNA threonylcarbamoyladenosine biosynthesis protein TsaE
MSAFQFSAKSEADTARLGAALAEFVTAGGVVTLEGPLGAGKTRLVQAWGEALGVDSRAISSPTFVLCHEYHGRLTIYHFDAYRAKNAAEFWDLGIDEYYRAGGVVLIEWASRVAECLPEDRLEIAIEITGEASRQFTFTPHGAAAQASVNSLALLIESPRLPNE